MVRVKILGRTGLLPNSLQEALVDIEKSTKNYSHHFLNVAIAYTGRAEIVDATKKIIEDVNQGVLYSQQLDEDTFMKYLYTAHLPNPNHDLVITHSADERLNGVPL